MITKCKFDKNKDIKETVPGLSVSIAEALVSGVIKDTGTSTPYTEVDNPGEVGYYLKDGIDIALAAQKLGEQISTAPVAPQGEDTK